MKSPAVPLRPLRLLDTFKTAKSSAEFFKQPPMQTSLDNNDNEEDAQDKDVPLPDAYNPEDYENLAVSAELKTLFKLINRYSSGRF